MIAMMVMMMKIHHRILMIEKNPVRMLYYALKKPIQDQ